jgi:hypothetical protein
MTGDQDIAVLKTYHLAMNKDTKIRVDSTFNKRYSLIKISRQVCTVRIGDWDSMINKRGVVRKEVVNTSLNDETLHTNGQKSGMSKRS